MRFPLSSLLRRFPPVALLCWTGAPPLQAQQPSPPPVLANGKFPIAVWLQSSRHAARYQAAGINVYVSLSDKLDAASLDALSRRAH